MKTPGGKSSGRSCSSKALGLQRKLSEMKPNRAYPLACAALAALAIFLNPASAAAQAKPFASLDEAAEYKGADRTARLLEGAKKEGMLNPRWKGKLGIEAEDADWLAGVMEDLGEARGTKLFKEIVAKNGMSVRKGHTLLTQLVASGEVPFALTVYNYKAEQLKVKGAPIAWLAVGTAIARPNGLAIAKRAPNPHSALLFYDFEISEEGQKVLLSRDFVPVNRKVDTPLGRLPLKFVDARVMLDDYDKWVKLYEEIFRPKQ